MFFRLLWNEDGLVNPTRTKAVLRIYWTSIIQMHNYCIPSKEVPPLNKKKENLLRNGINLSEQVKEMVKNVRKYFSEEEDRRCTLYPFTQVLRRVSEATGVSMEGLSRICCKKSRTKPERSGALIHSIEVLHLGEPFIGFLKKRK